ncbi:hypothetical protein AKJ40_03525 [candidate division MSBL1 archaeon SCGC-AAA259M10]|uniref:Tyr recombinase domain-containing protein n=2 Tax=candidate division MSBL1 TaxID=215777 RepID=A0A656YWW7_9EURY|nr:hypothetical protein AKJ39_02395 [candidate division MSBL1 archaeon SCGC-AAA259J03]KXA99274.1 hypothetical protein AKJ40_03525 [candidate division MSBL1 archaeon SCGC-AAA259M10]
MNIDEGLAERTINQHLNNIKDLSSFLDKPLTKVTKQDLRDYLKKYKKYSRSYFANKIKSLRAFYGRFLDTDLADSFKIPQPQSENNQKVPDRKELERFYNNIDGRAGKKYRAFFLIKATSGLRTNELTNLTMENLDLEERMIEPNHNSKTKRSYISFYNQETEKVLKKFLPHRKEDDERLFQVGESNVHRKFRKISEKANVKIIPKMLRKWFTKQMQNSEIPGKYIDAFCGRLPRSVRAKHYTDYSPERLKEIYENADIKVLE